MWLWAALAVLPAGGGGRWTRVHVPRHDPGSRSPSGGASGSFLAVKSLRAVYDSVGRGVNMDSSNAADESSERVADEQQDRYAELNINDEEVVIYDRENRRAWIQSSVAVAVEKLR